MSKFAQFVEAVPFLAPASVAPNQPLPKGPAWLTWRPVAFDGSLRPFLRSVDEDGLLVMMQDYAL